MLIDVANLLDKFSKEELEAANQIANSGNQKEAREHFKMALYAMGQSARLKNINYEENTSDRCSYCGMRVAPRQSKCLSCGAPL